MELSFRRERPQAAAFVIVCLCLWLLHWTSGVTWFPADAGYYWSLSVKDPSAVMTPLRGYVYPALLWPLRTLGEACGHPFLVFQLVSAIVYAWMFTGPISDLFAHVLGGLPGLAKRVAIALLPVTVFPGLFLYPLSDLPALVLVLLATRAMLATSGPQWWLAATLAGAAMSAAYNIRTIYLFTFLAMLPLIAFHFMKGQAVVRRATAIGLVFCGALVVATPQMIFNHARGGAAVPWLEVSVEGGSSLMASQLLWGITMQKAIGIRGADEVHGLYYRDPAGVAIRAAEGGHFVESSIKAYAGLVLRHPMAFAGIVTRHVINGLDVRDGMVYEKRRPEGRDWTSFVCATLLFAGVAICLGSEIRLRTLVPFVPVLLAVAAIAPGAVESRFFLPVYVVLAGMAIVAFERREVVRFVGAHCWSIAITYVAWVAIFLAATTSAMSEGMLSIP
jgi:hypothetical protein